MTKLLEQWDMFIPESEQFESRLIDERKNGVCIDYRVLIRHVPVPSGYVKCQSPFPLIYKM
jgi:hypothetical protein